MFGHFGIECDLTTLSAAEHDGLAQWIGAYKRYRSLFHTGRSVHADSTDTAIDVRGVVSTDRRRALYAVIQRDASVTYPPGRIALPGLDPDLVYEIVLADPTTEIVGPGRSPLAWATATPPIRLSGRLLEGTGVRAPVQFPSSVVLIEAIAEADPGAKRR
ncbi:MAG: GH36 C-terminal domain-containing protein [Galbitalea sp.]